MFYKAKKNLIVKSIRKRNKDNKFDYEKAESYKITIDDDPLINNSYYFSSHSEDLSIFFRLGLRSNVDETWFYIRYKGETYSLKEEFFSFETSPLIIKRVDDNWDIYFSGTLNFNDDVEFKAVFTPTYKPLNFSTDMPEERMATGIANEKWNKEFFKELDNIKVQTHYEQSGRLKGAFTLHKEKIEFDLPCLRDHSFGKRDWKYMNNHLWIMALNDSEEFNYSLVSYPVMSLLEVGYFKDSTKKDSYLLSANYDLGEISKSIVPAEFKMKIKLTDGRLIDVCAKVIDTIPYRFSNGAYTLYESIADYLIDGVKFKGIFEIGFNKDKSRIFNSRNLDELKR